MYHILDLYLYLYTLYTVHFDCFKKKTASSITTGQTLPSGLEQALQYFKEFQTVRIQM